MSFIVFFSCHQDLFIFLLYQITVSWLSYSVSMWSLGQHVCRFSVAIAHLSSYWCLGNLQNHPVSLKKYASLLIANSKSVLSIKGRKTSHVIVFKKDVHTKLFQVESVLNTLQVHWIKVFIWNFCLSSNASLSWLGTSFFPRVRHLWIRCMNYDFNWLIVDKRSAFYFTENSAKFFSLNKSYYKQQLFVGVSWTMSSQMVGHICFWAILNGWVENPALLNSEAKVIPSLDLQLLRWSRTV